MFFELNNSEYYKECTDDFLFFKPNNQIPRSLQVDDSPKHAQ